MLGRLASEVATILRGKHKPMYAPHMDTGDHVVVVNADKIELTGNKGEDKYAYRHSGYPGGIRAVKYKDLMATRPVAAVEKAVRGMLPKNTIGRQMLKKLHVVPGPDHPHAAQSPVVLALGERPAWDGLPAKPARRGGEAEGQARREAEGDGGQAEGVDREAQERDRQAEDDRGQAQGEERHQEATAAKPKAKSATKSTSKAKPAAKKKTETEE